MIKKWIVNDLFAKQNRPYAQPFYDLSCDKKKIAISIALSIESTTKLSHEPLAQDMREFPVAVTVSITTV